MNLLDEIPIEQQVKIIFPLFEKYAAQFKVKLSHAVKEDLTKKAWNFILNERQATEFISEHVVESNWPAFKKYFKQKERIYFFYQEPIKGLVVIESKLWAFLDIKTAVEFFKRQKEKPAKFTPATTKTLPFFSLIKGFIKNAQTLAAEPKKANFVLGKVHTLLRMSYDFFSEEEQKAFYKIMKSLTSKLTFAEAKQLITDIKVPNIPQKTLDKRLQIIYDICKDLYLSKPTDLEKKYLNKVLSKNKEDTEKGLKFLSKYIEKNEIASQKS